jgi:nucleoside-diphosphate-sugar epimerase
MHVYIAGGTGAIGTRLIPQLVERGHRVTATTTNPAKQDGLRRLGANPVVVDGLDSAAVGEAVATAEPDAVVHQMSSLSGRIDPKHFDRSFALTNRLRTEGLDHLVAAAQATGVPHLVAQSYTGWPNVRSGGWVKDEEDPLDPEPPKAQRESLAAIRYLEETVQKVDGTVLRYGGFYGDASDTMIPIVRKRQLPLVGGGIGYMSWVHLDDAASMLTRTRGSSNARAKRELGWELRWPSWRQGFRHGLAGV